MPVRNRAPVAGCAAEGSSGVTHCLFVLTEVLADSDSESSKVIKKVSGAFVGYENGLVPQSGRVPRGSYVLRYGGVTGVHHGGRGKQV